MFDLFKSYVYIGLAKARTMLEIRILTIWIRISPYEKMWIRYLITDPIQGLRLNKKENIS